MKLFCFGNEFVKGDAAAKLAAGRLRIKGVEMVKCDSVEEMLRQDKNPTILDVAEGIQKPMLIGIAQLQDGRSATCHDLDLCMELQLLKAAGELDDARILAVPMSASAKDIETAIKELLL